MTNANVVIVGYKVCADIEGVMHYTPEDDSKSDTTTDVEAAEVFERLHAALKDLRGWRNELQPYIVVMLNDGTEVRAP